MSDPEPDHISLESETEEEFAEDVQVDEDSSEEEEEEEDEDEDEDDDDTVLEIDDDGNVIFPEVTPPRVSPAAVANFVPQPTNVCDEEVVSKRKAPDQTMSVSDDTSSQELNRSEIDGLFCPICMEAWTNGGDHQVCCLPCGHIYGLSCIQKWIRQRRGSGKCPQCNRRCTLKEVRLLYASRIVVVDEELRKKVQTLEAKCASLKMKQTECCKKEIEGQRRETELQQQVYQLKKRTSYLEGLLVTAEKRLSGSVPATSGFQGRRIQEYRLDSEDGKTGCTSNFVLQKEFHIEGARVFDMDATSQILVIARGLTGNGALHGLTKISLIAPHDRENIQLPANIKAVKDLRLSPHGRLALVASLGKKLSVISSETNNTILSYDLPAAAWSCSWDIISSHYAYAGLQNGMLLVFDMRQTRGPVESIDGLTCNPIHSLYSVSPKSARSSGVRTILSASSIGICEWNCGGAEKRPFLVPESENQGVCISLACSYSTNQIVASFRPKVEMRNEMVASQVFPTPATSLLGNCILGSHVLYSRMGSHSYQKLGTRCANVNDIRLPKSAIIDVQNDMSLFVSGDEIACEINLQSLPSLMTAQNLNPRKLPIRDVKVTHAGLSPLLGCLCDDMLQLYSPKLFQ